MSYRSLGSALLLLMALTTIGAERRHDVTSQIGSALIGGILPDNNVVFTLGNGEGHLDTGSRIKRTTDNRQEKRSRKGGKRKQRKRKNQSKISAVHIEVNNNHPLATGTPLKTGERGSLIPYWKFADHGFVNQQRFARLENDGSIKIQKSGLYMIYSQMTYFDRTGRWSHIVGVNEKPFIKCLASEWGIGADPDTGVQYNTIHQCYTSAVRALQKGDQVGIYSMYPDRVMHEDKEMCFWGIIKLA